MRQKAGIRYQVSGIRYQKKPMPSKTLSSITLPLREGQKIRRKTNMLNADIDSVNKAIAAARGCIGTPFHHQGRTPGVGLDCVGLIVVALGAAGFAVNDRRDYPPRPDGKSLVRALEEHGAVAVDGFSPGDVLLFRYDHQPQHVALATGADTMVHAFAPAGRVVETTIGDYWLRRLLGVYRFFAPSRKSCGFSTLPQGEGD